MMQSLLAVKEICDILVVDEDLSKVVKTNQESSAVSLLSSWSTLILLFIHLISTDIYFYYILTYGAMSRSEFEEASL